MWDTIVGGAIALAGVALAEIWQSRRAHAAANRRLKIDQATRLRAAYLEVVAHSEAMSRSVVGLALAAAVARQSGNWAPFTALLGEASQDVTAAQVAVRLESGDDPVLAKLGEMNAAYTTYLATFNSHVDKDEVMPVDEFTRFATAMRDLGGELVDLARTQLASLESRE